LYKTKKREAISEEKQ